MLSHAFRDNYDMALLFAGDGDYVPLVEEVKRMGKSVYLFAFRGGLSPDLKLACDGLVALDPIFTEAGALLRNESAIAGGTTP